MCGWRSPACFPYPRHCGRLHPPDLVLQGEPNPHHPRVSYRTLELANEQSLFLQDILDLLHRIFASVELFSLISNCCAYGRVQRRGRMSESGGSYHSSPQGRIRARPFKDLSEMPWVPRPAGRDDGDLDVRLDVVYQLEIETGVRAVLVDAVQQDLARAHRLDGGDELDDVEIARFAAPLVVHWYQQ